MYDHTYHVLHCTNIYYRTTIKYHALFCTTTVYCPFARTSKTLYRFLLWYQSRLLMVTTMTIIVVFTCTDGYCSIYTKCIEYYFADLWHISYRCGFALACVCPVSPTCDRPLFVTSLIDEVLHSDCYDFFLHFHVLILTLYIAICGCGHSSDARISYSCPMVSVRIMNENWPVVPLTSAS